jgi:CheY-like chemotaxis protein
MLEPDLGLVRIDSASFHQVMMNLAANSRDAMPRGGTLTISTSNIAMTSSQTSVIPQGEYVRMTITDNGTGMTPEIRSHMFEPFFTTKATGRGTGLGLSAVYGIVQQSAGHVAVETEPGRGTAFHIYLPRVYAPTGSVTQPAVDLCALPGGPETILLVEDREDVRTLTVSILRGLGYVVIEADGPESALELAGDGSRPIHLLITDVVMPGIPVTEMAARLQALRPNMKVLCVSGGGDANAVPAGPGYLAKPFTPAELAGAVRALLDEM